MPIGSKRMSAVYKGRNVATRPIPRDIWTDESREFSRNTVQRKLKSAQQGDGIRRINAPQLQGRKSQAVVRGGSFVPSQSNSKFL